MKNRLKKLQFILFDVDGTLLSDEGNIGSETIRLTKELKQRGVQFSFASGRLHSALIGFADQLELQVPLISLDGCLIKSNFDGKVIFESVVKETYVTKAVNYADKFLLNIALCHTDAIYYTERNSAVPQILDKYGARYEEVESLEPFYNETLEVVFAGDNKNSINFIYNRLTFPYATGLNTSMFKSQRKSSLYYLEVRRKGSSKRTGFLRLLKYLKIKVRNSAVIGDWYNDLSLFKTNALKVAVVNAVPELRRNADITTSGNNNEDGVAEFLEMVFKAKKDK